MIYMNERPKAQRKGRIHVDNRQLRDLVHATENAGEILSVQSASVVRYNVYSTEPSVKLAHIQFRPTTLSYSPSRSPSQPGLIAVGGRNGKVMLISLKSSKNLARESFSLLQESAVSSSIRSETITTMSIPNPTRDIVNSVSFAPSPYDTSSLDSSRSMHRRLLVSSNDKSVRIFQLDESRSPGTHNKPFVVKDEGFIRYSTCINHASVSPDGRILLTAGDTPHLHLHSLSSTPLSGNALSSTRFSGGTCSHKPIHVIPTSTLEGPSLSWHVGGEGRSSVEAIFSTAFSADGTKFASGSQDGIVQVWDIRSLNKRLALFNTAPPHLIGSRWSMRHELEGNVDPELEKGVSLGKNWGIRCLRFSPASSFGFSGPYRELLAFSSHQSNLHFVDARTFDTNESFHTSLFLPDVFKRHTLSSYSNDPAHVDLTEPITPSSFAKKRKRADSDGDGNVEPKRREGLPSAEDITINNLRAELALQIESDPALRHAANTLSWSTQSQDGLSTSAATALTGVPEDVNQAQSSHAEPSVSSETAAGGERDDAFLRQTDDLLQSSERLAMRLRGVSSRLQEIVERASGITGASSSSALYTAPGTPAEQATSIPPPPQPEPPAVQSSQTLSPHLTLPTQLPVLQVTPPLRSSMESEEQSGIRLPERRYGVYIPDEREGNDPVGASRRQMAFDDTMERRRAIREAWEALGVDIDAENDHSELSDEEMEDDELDLPVDEGERPSFARDALHAAMRRWGLRSGVEGIERGEELSGGWTLPGESDEDVEEDDVMDLNGVNEQLSSSSNPVANGVVLNGAGNDTERLHSLFGPRSSNGGQTTSRSDRWRHLQQQLSANRAAGPGLDSSEPLLLGFLNVNSRPRFVASPEPLQPPLPTLGGTSNRLTNRVVRMFGNPPTRSRFDAGSHLLSPPPPPAWQLFGEPSIRRPFSSRVFGGGAQSFSSVSLRTNQAQADESDEDGLVYTDEENEEEKAFEDGPVEIAGFAFGIPGTASDGTLVIGATLPSPSEETKPRMSEGLSKRWGRGAAARLVLYDMADRKPVVPMEKEEGTMRDSEPVMGSDEKVRPTWPLRTRKGFSRADFV
ncbi:hypothetical protein FRC20_002714 [Serendipita sp. 405]|nr:hypothetical protein FRC20_002714 [Serendipita sp. 405]